MAKIIIIGAGLTGISTAYHLEQQGFFDYTLFEKESTIGGLCGSIFQDGFTFDYTGHLLHVNDAYFKHLIDTIVGIDNMNQIVRRSFIYSHHVYTHYPFQIHMHGLPAEVIAECIEGFVTRKQSSKEPKNFYNWVLAHFGQGIAKHFFIPFQTKILDYDIKKITASWTGRFVPKTTLRDMIAGSLSDHREPSIGYNSHFLYPKKGGIIFWVKKLADCLVNKVQLNAEVERIDIHNKIVFFSNGHFEHYDKLITTMPLDSLLDTLIEPSNSFLKKQRNKLVCNSVINFNIGVHHNNLSDKHWIYYPEHHYPFYRIGFPHNFSEAAVPKGCSSLYGELSFTNKDSFFVNTKLTEALSATKKLFSISNTDIATEKIIHIRNAYVIYDVWREKNLPKLLLTLEQHALYSIGRYGAWKYSSMQEAVLDGKEIAEKILTQQGIIIMPQPTKFQQKEGAL